MPKQKVFINIPYIDRYIDSLIPVNNSKSDKIYNDLLESKIQENTSIPTVYTINSEVKLDQIHSDGNKIFAGESLYFNKEIIFNKIHNKDFLYIDKHTNKQIINTIDKINNLRLKKQGVILSKFNSDKYYTIRDLKILPKELNDETFLILDSRYFYHTPNKKIHNSIIKSDKDSIYPVLKYVIKFELPDLVLEYEISQISVIKDFKLHQ